MGKRTGREYGQNKVGLSKVRYCRDHDDTVKPVKIFGKGMMWQCTKGCSLDKRGTVLKVPTFKGSR
jgi:hypothetical protein